MDYMIDSLLQLPHLVFSPALASPLWIGALALAIPLIALFAMSCLNFSFLLLPIRSKLFALDVSKAKVISFLFSISETKSSVLIELIFSDVWGPSPILSNNSARFFIIFVDHFSKFTCLCPIACRYGVFFIFPKF
jgi:hypothetical protein